MDTRHPFSSPVCPPRRRLNKSVELGVGGPGGITLVLVCEMLHGFVQPPTGLLAGQGRFDSPLKLVSLIQGWQVQRIRKEPLPGPRPRPLLRQAGRAWLPGVPPGPPEEHTCLWAAFLLRSGNRVFLCRRCCGISSGQEAFAQESPNADGVTGQGARTGPGGRRRPPEVATLGEGRANVSTSARPPSRTRAAAA